MKNYSAALLRFFLFVLPMGLLAQELPNIIPKSPDVASFGKFIDLPVGKSTGIASIAVPLVTLPGKKINNPISLSYHSGGIRVGEMASRVGLGWNLNAGGMITRSVRGIPDDYASGYLNTTTKVSDFLDGTVTERIDWLILYGNNNDYESDIYTYNLLGQSGTFFFKQDGEIMTYPKTDLKISVVKNGALIVGWEITTTDGTVYYLGTSKDGTLSANDTTTSSSASALSSGGHTFPDASPAMTNYINTWHLMDIETIDKEMITYRYNQPKFLDYWSLGGQQKQFAYGGGPSGSIQTYYSRNEDYVHTLDNISNSHGRVDFIYGDNSREDLVNDHALTELRLYDFNNKEIDRYVLDYGYFVSNTNSSNVTIGNFNQRRKRLYLKTVTQEKDGENNKIHSFIYNTSHILPDRFSYAQDFWGFYNGKNNAFLFPNVKMPLNGIYVEIVGGDRKVDETYSKACVLQKIIYPTGGSTEFSFESNNISNGRVFDLTEMETVLIDELSTVGSSDFTFEKVISITDSSEYEGGIAWDVNFESNCNNPSGFECPKAFLYKYNNGNYELISESSGEDSTLYLQFDGNNSMQLKVVINNHSGQFGEERNDISTTILGYKLPEGSQNAILSGGLRINKMTFRDSDNSISLEKEYLYTKFNDSTTSSGTSLNSPVFVIPDHPFASEEHEVVKSGLLKSNSIFSLTNGGSYTTIYTNVTELFGGGEIGKIEYENIFTYDGEASLGGESYAVVIGANPSVDPATFILDVPSQNYSHRRGMLLNKRVYKKDSNSYKLVEEENNIYNPLLGTSNYDISTINIKIGFAAGNKVGGFLKYRNLSERFYKEETIFKKYFDNEIVETRSKYKYDPNYSGRTFPIEIETTNSEGEVLKTVTEYALEKNDIRLLNENRIQVPLSEASYKNTTKLSEQNTVYGDFNGIYLSNAIQTSKGSNPLENRIEFHDYDDYGNPLEVSKTDGTHIVYIWGYNNTQPVAKIENATYSQVISQVANIQAKSNLDDDHCQDSGNCDEKNLRTALNVLRNSLPNAMVSTYTYDPLVGVTSMTDPKGYTVYYEYDNFNRLKRIKDEDGKVMSENQYHYKQ